MEHDSLHTLNKKDFRLNGLISRYMGESIAKLRLAFDAMHEFRKGKLGCGVISSF